MCGRGGRGGSPARAHIFYNSKQKCKDKKMLSYCIDSENCLRRALIGGVGGDISSVNGPRFQCCSSCSGGTVPYVHTDILNPLRSHRPKRVPSVREVPQEMLKGLEQQLKEARDDITTSTPGLEMLGAQFVCPDAVIASICSNINTITSISDLNSFFLRPEYRNRFFEILSDTVRDAPPPTRRRRNK